MTPNLLRLDSMPVCKDTKVKQSAMKKIVLYCVKYSFRKVPYNWILNYQTPDKYLGLITKYSYQRDSLYDAMKYVTLFVSYSF